MTARGQPPDIGSSYVIEREIGRGGMATVYRAHDRRHNRRVAVKVLDPGVAATLGTTRFLQEIATAAGLSHPNIVPVYDSGEHDGVVYYVMPYVEGSTLREQLSGGKQLPAGEVARIAVRIASALDFAHRNGIVHRDIKPENIMLFEGEPLVLDFGIARAITAAAGDNLTRTGVAIGTPAYISPEQASGDSGLDGRSDQYSLACTLYEMVAGTQPFTGATSQGVIAKRFTERPQSLAGIVPDVTRAFADALTRALSLEPADRFPTASEFAQELARAVHAADARAKADASAKSVAVLPFTNTSADAENEFFADGITEEIINALTRVRALRVPARTASFAFKGKTEAIEEIARKLRVGNILEGSVRRAGNRLRVTVQLVAAPGGDTIWSDRYDRELADVFAIQDEIATNIVDALKVVLSGEEEVAIRKVPTQSIRAYEYYLRGRQLYHQRKPEPLAAAEEMFRRAIALDPGYALAYAGLADASGVRHGSFGGGEEALAQADAASRRALELDPMLAEAHAARGLALSYHAQFDEADSELREAIRLDPSSYDNAYHYARVLVSAGRLEEAARMFETAASLRPEDYQALALANNMYNRLGREAEERDAGLRAIEAATHALAINPADTRALTLGASTFLRIGEEERGREWLERALKLDATNPITFYNASCFESLAGRTDVALDYLQRAVHLGLHNVHWLLNDPDIVSLRDHPRFATVLREAEAAAAG